MNYSKTPSHAARALRRVEKLRGGKVEWWKSGEVQLWLANGCAPSYDLLLLRSDDLERLVRGAGSDGFKLGTGLVVFDNVPRLRA